MAKQETPHKTIRIKVKGGWADVDVKMIPLVRWLNTLRGVRTFACCEGYEDHEPYVAFTCTSMASLETILRTLIKRLPTSRTSLALARALGRAHGGTFKRYARCDADFYPVAFRQTASFSVRFCSKQHLRDYLRRIRRL